MSLSGPDVHQQLMNAYAETQARLEDERAAAMQLQFSREELSNDRGDALVNLAEFYLPELSRDAIETTWLEIRPTVSNILLGKEDHRRRLQETIDQVTADLEKDERQLLEINARLDESIERRQRVSQQVEQRLRDDEGFVQLSGRAATAEAALERAEANLHEIAQDSARKLPAYEKSELFQYLYQRGYGTPAYTKRGFVRRMDRGLAGFIGYAKARQGYEFLKQTPDQMRKLIAEDRRSLDTVMAELERRRDEIAEEFRLAETIEQSDALGRDRDEHLDALNELRLKSESVQEELAGLDGTQGPYYREAIRLFRELLDKYDSGELKQRAGRTPEITDDQIVARLVGVEMEMDTIDEAAQRERRESVDRQEFLAGLGRLLQRFRAAQFDSARSQFVESLDISEEIDRAGDAKDVDRLWQQIRRAQRWGPTAMDKVSSVTTHPMTQVLINAMANAAGGAMQGHARRAGDRRRVQRDGQVGGDSSQSGQFPGRR